MAWARTTRITLVVTFLLAGATLAWLAAHPSIYAAHVGRLLTRNLLRDTGASFTCRDLSGNPFSRIVFHKVSITRAADDGSFFYVTADSLVIAYELGRLMRREQRLEEIEIGGADVLMRQPSVVATKEDVDDDRRIELPRMAVERVRVNDLGFVLTAPDGVELQEIRDLTLESTVSPSDEYGGLDVQLRYFTGSWPTANVNVHRLSADMHALPPRLDFRNVEVALDSTRARLDMTVEFGGGGVKAMDLRGEAERFVLNELMVLLGKPPEGPHLDLAGAAQVTFDGQDLTIDGRGQGTLDGAPVSATTFVGRVRDGLLVFEEIEGSYRSARGRATGSVTLEADPPHLSLVGTVEGVDASDPWTPEDLGWPASVLSGRARIELDLGDSVAIEMLLDDVRGEIATLPVDSGSVDVRWSMRDGLDLRSARVRSLAATIDANGKIDADEQTEIFLRVNADFLGPWAARVGLPIEGQGLVAAGAILGPVDSLRAVLAGTVGEARLGPLTAREGRGRVEIPDLSRPERMGLDLYAPQLSIYERSVGSLDLELAQRDSVTEFERLEIAIPDSQLITIGRMTALPDSSFRIEVDGLSLSLGDDEWRLEDRALLDVAPHRFTTSGFDFVSDTGRFAVVGSASRQGEFDLQAQVVDGDLSLLERIGVLQGISGRVDGAFVLAGSSRDPRIDITASVQDLIVQGRRIQEGRAVVGVEGARIGVSHLELDSAGGGASISGDVVLASSSWMETLRENPDAVLDLWRDARLDLLAEPSGLALAYWIEPGIDPEQWGRLSGSLRLRDTAGHPRVDGTVALESLAVEPFFFPRFEGRIHADSLGVSLAEGLIDLGGPDLRAQGVAPIVLSLAGPSRYEPQNGIDFLVESGGEIDLSSLPRVFDLLRRVEGKGTLRIAVQGDPRDPRFSGDLRIRKGRVELEGWSEWLRDLEIDGRLENDRLLLTRITAKEGAKGRVDGTGEVVFVGLLPDDVSLDIRADRVLLASVPFLRAVGSSEDLKLRLARVTPDAPRAPKITGTFVVDKAIYTGEFAESGNQEAVLGATAAPLWLADIRVQLRDQVRISNQSAELRVQGDVDFIRDQNGIRFRGRGEIPSGRVPLFNNDFTITEGSLDFSRRPLEPEVDIVAVTEVPIYDPSGSFGRELERITVHLTGTFLQPKVAFRSENGLDQNSILRLLAGFGGGGTGTTPGIGSVGLRAGLNFLERALAQEIRGVDTIDIETEEAGIDQMSSTRIAVGKYLSSNLYLRYSQGLSITERDLFLEYQIGRRTLLTSELKRRLREQGAENEFNLDLKWRVRY